jgi:hypothetical protein
VPWTSCRAPWRRRRHDGAAAAARPRAPPPPPPPRAVAQPRLRTVKTQPFSVAASVQIIIGVYRLSQSKHTILATSDTPLSAEASAFLCGDHASAGSRQEKCTASHHALTVETNTDFNQNTQGK